MNTFFCSDTHFGHDKIRIYCGRPFLDLKTMDKTIIDNFNSKVKEDDLCFFIGDFCFCKSNEAQNAPRKAFDYYRNQLICKNIIFIMGNHDKNNSVRTPIQNISIKYGGKCIFLVHNPEFCNINYEINLCGHVHEKWDIRRYRKCESFTDCINISVEQWDYYPVSWDEIWARYSRWLKENKNE